MTVSPSAAPAVSLLTSEGALVSVSIAVDPRRLEALLDALAQLDFPINPQLYHDAEVIFTYPDAREESEPATLVEFPAVAGRLDQVTRALEAGGFDPARSMQATAMWNEVRADCLPQPAPAGAPFVSRRHRKFRRALTRSLTA